MYFPYLRGRQYELLALRELIINNKLCSSIVPIIEPVKMTSTFASTVDSFINAGHDIALIFNPEVGTFKNDIEYSQKNPKKNEYFQYLLEKYSDNHVIKSIIVKNDAVDFIGSDVENKLDKSQLLVINNHEDDLDLYEKEFYNIAPRYVLIPDEGTFRRRVRDNRVLLDDKFKRQNRNSDYSKRDDEFFSDDHLYYKNDSFKGFSDYSIIGKEYTEAGFAPYAVAIHIVYFDSKKNLRVRHFVSKSNEDIANTAGKFYEAVSKLHDWCVNNPQFATETIGLNTLLNHYDKGTYPGLGTVKKLSLMHHLELMNKYFSEVNNNAVLQ